MARLGVQRCGGRFSGARLGVQRCGGGLVGLV